MSPLDLFPSFGDEDDVFDGSQVTVARQLSGLNQVEFGQRIESRGKEDPAKRVRNWEGGVRPIRPLLEQLAFAGGVDTTFFFSPASRVAALQPPLFCKHSAATLRARSQAEGLIHLAEKIVSFAEERTGKVIRPNLPTLDASTPSSPSPEQAALLTREWMKIEDGPIEDLVELAEGFGVLIAFSPLNIRTVQSYGLRTKDRALVILNPTDQDRYFMRFKFAHELGHLVMHRGLDTKKLKKPAQREVENHANRFAAEFLTPSAGVMQTLVEARKTNTWKSLFVAKEYWGVPVKSVIVRMNTLGLLSEDEYRRAQIRYQTHAADHRRAIRLETFGTGQLNATWMNQSEPGKSKQLESVAVVPSLVGLLDMTHPAIAAQLGFPVAYLDALISTEPRDVLTPAAHNEHRHPAWSGSPLDFQDYVPDEPYD